MRSNIGGDDLPRGTVSLADDMAAFDRLPVTLRRQLSGMAVNWNASAVRQIAHGYGAKVALTVLRKTETDMRRRYCERIGL